MTAPLTRPKRKDPLKKTRQPLYPQSIRSRTAQGLTAAAANDALASNPLDNMPAGQVVPCLPQA